MTSKALKRAFSSATSSNQKHRIVYGTMNFAAEMSSTPVDQTVANQMLDIFAESAPSDEEIEIDTALLYSNGKSEKMLGVWLQEQSADLQRRIKIAGKCNPLFGPFTLEGTRNQLMTSTESIGASIDTFYLHQPDLNTPLEETLKALQSFKKEGLFNHYGISNYASWEFVKMCESELGKPKTVQCMYNPLTRVVEKELIPAIKSYDSTFLSYNSLAGGLLTGKYQNRSMTSSGRFTSPNYKQRFWNDGNLDLVEKLLKLCHENSLSLIQATYSWLLFHSQIRQGVDGVLLGTSSVEQLKDTLNCISNAEPLHEKIIENFELLLANNSQFEKPCYFRGFSGIPGSDGSGYVASKAK